MSFSAIDARIAKLAGSGSFAATHEAITDLAAIEFFSTKQVNYLVKVLSQNNQINWIFTDSDVKGFFGDLYEKYKSKLGPLEETYLLEMLSYNIGDPIPDFAEF